MKKEMLELNVENKYIIKVGVGYKSIVLALDNDVLECNEDFKLKTRFKFLNGEYHVVSKRFAIHLGEMMIHYNCRKVEADVTTGGNE